MIMSKKEEHKHKAILDAEKIIADKDKKKYSITVLLGSMC